MRKALLVLWAVLGMYTTSVAQHKIQTIKIKTRIACDHCKMCGSCGARIEKALYDQKGIKRVDVDDKKKEIIVVYNTGKISKEKIKETITNNGYDADDRKATPESYATLDECCKGTE